MTANEAVLRVVDALDALAIPYMLVGSYSSNVFGVARGTQDADFVVQLGDTSISQIHALLGKAFELDPQMSFETVTGTYRYVMSVRESLFKVELFLLSDDDHDQERFRRRLRGPALGRELWVPTPEDVVITKLRWSRQGQRTKDREDARNVMRVQVHRLDWEYIHRWCDEHGTRKLLDDIRTSLPPL